MSDITLISRAIVEGFNVVNEPLTESQKMYLHGAIAGYLINIEQIGLQRVLMNLANDASEETEE